jgi:glutamate/aspartate transport system substrate-binding protein
MRLKAMLTTLAAVGLLAGTAAAQDGTLKKIKDTGTITIGHRESSVPFSYYDDKQQVVGYAMDLCNKIVDAVKANLQLSKLEVKLQPVTSATRIPLLANGTTDLECGSTTNNLERQKQVSFTITHFVTANRFVSKKAANLKKLEDLKGKTVVSTSGTTNIKQITELNTEKNLGLNILPAKDHAEASSQAPRRPRTTISPPMHCRSSHMASCCGRTIRPSRRWSMTPWSPSTKAARSIRSTTSGSSM